MVFKFGVENTKIINKEAVNELILSPNILSSARSTAALEELCPNEVLLKRHCLPLCKNAVKSLHFSLSCQNNEDRSIIEKYLAPFTRSNN